MELNAGPRGTHSPEGLAELTEFLATASDALYRHALLSEKVGRPLPPALRRAHASVRAELERLAQDSAER